MTILLAPQCSLQANIEACTSGQNFDINATLEIRTIELMWRPIDYVLSRPAVGKLYYFLNYCWTSLYANQDLNSEHFAHVSVGRHTYGLRQLTVIGATEETPVSIGAFCSIAPGAIILGHVGHPTHLPSTFPIRSRLFRRQERAPAGRKNHDAVTRGPIIIGHDVWIGQNAIILSGTKIGTGAVIGAGAVVAKDIPPYAIAVGNPANVIRFRFDPETITELLETAWWELPDSSLARLDAEFYQSDIAVFLQGIRRERERLAAGKVKTAAE